MGLVFYGCNVVDIRGVCESLGNLIRMTNGQSWVLIFFPAKAKYVKQPTFAKAFDFVNNSHVKAFSYLQNEIIPKEFVFFTSC